MAKILMSSLVSDIRGSVAGSVYSANKNGAYVRNKGTMTNTNTIAQQEVRLAFGAIAAAWRGLTDVQRETFSNYVQQYPYTDKLGQTKYYTPYQLFAWQNNSAQFAGFNPIAVCLAPVTVAEPQNLQVVDNPNFTDGDFNISLQQSGEDVVQAGSRIIIEATAPLSPGITAPKRPMYKKIMLLLPAAAIDSVGIFTAYQSVFAGTPTVGNSIFVRVTAVMDKTGQRSVPLELRTKVTG